MDNPEGHVPEGHVPEGHVPERHVPERHEPEGHVEMTPAEARGGGGVGRHLFVMLAVSTVAAAIVMGAFWTLAGP